MPNFKPVRRVAGIGLLVSSIVTTFFIGKNYGQKEDLRKANDTFKKPTIFCPYMVESKDPLGRKTYQTKSQSPGNSSLVATTTIITLPNGEPFSVNVEFEKMRSDKAAALVQAFCALGEPK